MQIRSRKPVNQPLASIASVSNDSYSQYHSFREEGSFPKVSLKSMPNKSQSMQDTEKVQIWPKKQELKVENPQKSLKQRSNQQNATPQVNRTIYDLVSHIGVVDNSSEELSNEIKQANKERRKIFSTQNSKTSFKQSGKQNISTKDRNSIDPIKQTNNSQSLERRPQTNYFQKILTTKEGNPEPKYSFLPDDSQEFKIQEEPEVKREIKNYPRSPKNSNIQDHIFESNFENQQSHPSKLSANRNNQIVTPNPQRNVQVSDYQSNAYSTPSFSPQTQKISQIYPQNSQYGNQKISLNQAPIIQEQDRTKMQSILRIYPQVLSRLERNQQEIAHLSRKLDEIVKQQQHRQKMLYSMIRQKQTEIMNKEKEIVVYRQGIHEFQQKERIKKDQESRKQLQIERARRLQSLIEENHRLCSEIMSKRTSDQQYERNLKEKMYQAKINDLHSSSSFQPSTTTYYTRHYPSQNLSQTRSYEGRHRRRIYYI